MAQNQNQSIPVADEHEYLGVIIRYYSHNFAFIFYEFCTNVWWFIYVFLKLINHRKIKGLPNCIYN